MLLELAPLDRVDVTTSVDNTADMLLPDVGPVRHWGLSGTSGPLVDVYQGGRTHRVLYDAGVSPFGSS
jgi:7,8-dihydropterin-6-yl-methyl-4-(beta-D-ribofuranosyl)aminobenzene 5'-phosphate synthase